MSDEPITKLKKLHAEAQALLDEKIETVTDEEQLTKRQKLAHFAARVYRSFIRNRCPIRAAALAYTTVLAVVPLLAVVLSVYTGLLKKETDTLDRWIKQGVQIVAPQLGLEEIKGGEKTLDEVKEKIESFIQNFQSGKLGATAIVAFIFVAISLLSTIEVTFNDIWGISRGRPWFARVVHYWAAITLGPLFLLAAFGLTGASHLPKAAEWLGQFKFAFDFIGPFAILSAILATLYLLMPNTKVPFHAAVAGGCVGGCLLQLNNLFNVMYVSRVVTYKQVYGGLAAVPLFLLGLYTSWIIVLLGAQVAYAVQNRKAYSLDKKASNVNQRGRETIALRLMTCVGQRFHFGSKAPTSLQMADEIGVSSRLVVQILEGLLQSGLLVEVAGEETAYAPGRCLDQITIHDILESLRVGQGRELATSDGPAKQVISEHIDNILRAERETASVTLQELVGRVGKS